MKTLSKISAIAILFLSMLTISCKDEEKKVEKEEVATETNSAEEIKKSMAQSEDVKYNPAHGVEGHRCDLPVGAPLDQETASQNTNTGSSPVRLQSATPRINPPHGEPGHDCSVAVGAELN